jgi:hypothetical protein
MVHPVGGTHDQRDDYLTDQLHRGPFILRKSGVLGTSAQPLIYGPGEHLVQSFNLREGHWVVFAKLEIINRAPNPLPTIPPGPSPPTNTVSVTCELHVGKQVDIYEVLEIAPLSMRLASLIVGANLTAEAEGKLVYKLHQPGPLPAMIAIVNVTIAATELPELRLSRT